MTRDTTLICQRSSVDQNGAFATVTRPDGTRLCYTGEHSYKDDSGKWTTKVQAGIYVCERGTHVLEHSDGTKETIETFEVLGVLGHSGILFTHVGNRPQVDSKGCFLAGRKIGTLMGLPSVDASRLAYADFMNDRVGIDSFKLVVKDPS